MGLHQYGFFILPKESYELIEKHHKLKIEDDFLFDDAPFWTIERIDCSYFENLDSILKKSSSWSKDILLFGDEESNRVEIYCENNKVVSASFRIDYLSNYEFVLRELINFFMQKELIIINEDLELMPMNYINFKCKIESSEQYKLYNNLVQGKDSKD